MERWKTVNWYTVGIWSILVYGVVPSDYITFTCKNKTTACFWKCSSHPMLGNSSLATIFQLCKLKLHIICQMRQVPTSPGFPGCSWMQSDSSKRIVELASKRKKHECKQLLILRFWRSTKVTKCIYSLSKNLHAKRVKTLLLQGVSRKCLNKKEYNDTCWGIMD